VQISTQSAQPMHLCSSTSGSIAIGIYNSLKLTIVRKYLNTMSAAKHCYNARGGTTAQADRIIKRK